MCDDCGLCPCPCVWRSCVRCSVRSCPRAGPALNWFFTAGLRNGVAAGSLCAVRAPGGLCKVSPPPVLVRRQPFIGPVGQGCRMGCQLHVNLRFRNASPKTKISGARRGHGAARRTRKKCVQPCSTPRLRTRAALHDKPREIVRHSLHLLHLHHHFHHHDSNTSISPSHDHPSPPSRSITTSLVTASFPSTLTFSATANTFRHPLSASSSHFLSPPAFSLPPLP